MARIRTDASPLQDCLFVLNEMTGTLHPAESAITQPELNDTRNGLIDDVGPGPSVNILERNAHLQNMLVRLAVMSRTTGLQIASETGLRSCLEERYDDVDRVVDRAADKSVRKHREAKEEYAHAFGLGSLICSGLMSEADAKGFARRSYYEEILPVFADAKGHRSCVAMRRWLRYQERTLMGQRTRRPKVSLPKTPEVV